jgi:hypothetical protein
MLQGNLSFEFRVGVHFSVVKIEIRVIDCHTAILLVDKLLRLLVEALCNGQVKMDTKLSREA